MKKIDISIEKLRSFFATGVTQELAFRKDALTRLYKGIKDHEKDICNALLKDFNKPEFEVYVTEIGFVLDEIRYVRRHLKKWNKPKRVSTPLHQFPATSYIYREPYGTVLILAPWNYPFQLAISPLIGAIAAGNTVLLKPSELSGATSKVIEKIISKVFEKKHVSVVQGDLKTNSYILKKKFDYIFFTGSPQVGKIVMKAASAHLTPVTLELGGKSPVIVNKDANIALAAKRITWGKFINTGQTCVAPDYLFIHQDVKEQFIAEVTRVLNEFYGDAIHKSDNYPRMINQRHYERVKSYLKDGIALIGGDFNDKTRYIAPTILDQVKVNSKVMKDEIFGPLLPLLSFTALDEVISFINDRPKPLALYIFSASKKIQQKILAQTYSGGVTINDTIVHLANPALPFGGVDMSGMGAYHGRYSFETFTVTKSVMIRGTWLDLPFRYPPYTLQKLRMIKSLLR